MAILMRIGEDMREVLPKNGSNFELEELYELLDCDMVQVIPLKDGMEMIFDEEGKLKDHRVNHCATGYALGCLFPGDYIAGHALVINSSEFE